jgi:hypothetical protein
MEQTKEALSILQATVLMFDDNEDKLKDYFTESQIVHARYIFNHLKSIKWK